MDVQNRRVFITGANRGIGRALVDVALSRGANTVYAACRDLAQAPAWGDARVVPIALDITSAEQTAAAAEQAQDTDILINNAGGLFGGSLVDATDDDIHRNMDVNYFGTLSVIRAFLPAMRARRSGVIAAISSIVGLANSPALGAYSVSKAALFSALQDLRARLRPEGLIVAGIFPGPIDTDMTRAMAMKKHSVHLTASAIWDGLAAKNEDIFPDPVSTQLGNVWLKGPKDLEKILSA